MEVDVFTLYPDLAFVVTDSEGRSYTFVLELDKGTGRIRSKQDVESIERGYDAIKLAMISLTKIDIS